MEENEPLENKIIMPEQKIKCDYCFLEKLPQSIFYYKHDGVDRPICSDCKVAGKHWGTYKF